MVMRASMPACGIEAGRSMKSGANSLADDERLAIELPVLMFPRERYEQSVARPIVN